MSISAQTVQSAVDLYARSLRVPRDLFDLYPRPRPQGAPRKPLRAVPSAVVQGVTAAFEAFAEELLVVSLLRRGETWAQIAKNADLTNPTLKDLVSALARAAGIQVDPPREGGAALTWKTWKQSSNTGWARTRSVNWAELLRDSDCWMQVRHCLTHGLVTGVEPTRWPGPVTKRNYDQRHALPNASEVLARATDGRKALTLYPAVNCGLVYSIGGASIATQTAAALDEDVDIDGLLVFGDV